MIHSLRVPVAPIRTVTLIHPHTYAQHIYLKAGVDGVLEAAPEPAFCTNGPWLPDPCAKYCTMHAGEKPGG